MLYAAYSLTKDCMRVKVPKVRAWRGVTVESGARGVLEGCALAPFFSRAKRRISFWRLSIEGSSE